MEDALSIRKLSKRYEGFALHELSFTVPAGQIVGLIGENGAGKSTTLHAALDLIGRDGGEVLFWGQPLAGRRERLEEIGVVFDGGGWPEHLTARQLGRIGRAAYRQWDPAVYEHYLRRFSLPENKAIKDLSRGMQMLLSIAAALSHRPKLLILDEPTGGLDPVMRDDMLEVFLDFVQDERHAILLSSHISTDLEKIADRIVFLHRGRVIFDREKDDLRYRCGIVRCGDAEAAAIDPALVLARRREAYQWSILVSDKEELRRRHRELVVDDAGIDEIMLLYVKGETP